MEGGTAAAVDTTGFGAAALWASMASGTLPREHGIRDAFEVRPDGGGIQPVGASAWRRPPVWRLLAGAGVPVRVVSCPATVPADAWVDAWVDAWADAWVDGPDGADAVVVDERFASAPFSAVHADAGDWPLAPGCVHPAGLRPRLRGLRVHPAELDAAVLGGLPARAVAYAVSVQAVALALAGEAGWRFMAVGFPPLDGSDAGHAFVDMLLDRLIGGAGPGTDVVVVSAGGVVLAAGPGFARDTLLHGAAAVDVAATVLARFGLVDRGGAGRALPGTVIGGPLVPVRAEVAERPGRTVDPAAPAGAEAAIAEVDRRYRRHAAQEAVLLHDHAAAAVLLRDALEESPDDVELTLLLGQTAFLLEDAELCAALGAALTEEHPGLAWGPLLCGAALVLRGEDDADAPLRQAAALGGDEPAVLLRLGAIGLRRDRAAEARVHYAAVLPLCRDRPDMRAAAIVGLGLSALALGDDAEAGRRLREALGLRFDAPEVHLQLGLLHAREGRWGEASRALRTALGQRPGLVEAAQALRRVEDAAAARVTVAPN